MGMDDLFARFHSGVKIQNDDIGIMMREMVVVILDFRACQVSILQISQSRLWNTFVDVTSKLPLSDEEGIIG